MTVPNLCADLVFKYSSSSKGRLYSANEVNELNLQKLPQAPLGRQTMNGIKWLKTPFGYIESDIRVKSR